MTRLQAKSEKVRDGPIQCNECRGQFTVILGTVIVRGKSRKGNRDEAGDLIVNMPGRGTKKVPMVALVERDGRARRGFWWM